LKSRLRTPPGVIFRRIGSTTNPRGCNRTIPLFNLRIPVALG
jgi:hypothetical protein